MVWIINSLNRIRNQNTTYKGLFFFKLSYFYLSVSQAKKCVLVTVPVTAEEKSDNAPYFERVESNPELHTLAL
jgi:hypothetical protein